jgi:hypothetical protein
MRDELLSLGLAGADVGARLVTAGLVLRFFAYDRILRDAEHLAVQEPVAREVDRLNLCLLSSKHEADVPPER